MAIKIPLQLDSDNYEIKIVLDDVEFLFSFKYNGRADSWFFDILAADETPLRMGLSLVTGSDLFLGWQEVERPDGSLIAIASGEPTEPPTREDMQNGLVALYFVPTGEIEPFTGEVEDPGPVFFVT